MWAVPVAVLNLVTVGAVDDGVVDPGVATAAEVQLCWSSLLRLGYGRERGGVNEGRRGRRL